MAFTADDLAAIDKAIATGERTVSYAGRTVEFRSIAELLKARDAIRADLAAPPGGSTDVVRRYSRATFSKGR